MDWHPIQGAGQGVFVVLLVASYYGNRDQVRLDGSLGSSTDFHYR